MSAARQPVTVWDLAAQEPREVTAAEAAQGVLRYARTLRPGSPERGEWERTGLAMLPERTAAGE